MIDVDEKELIRRAYFLEGQSMRRIARERRHSRHTVRRALEDPGPPVYRLKAPKPRPVLGPYTALIDRWLQEDLERPPKQRHTARRVYDRLVAEHGFRGGASTVRQHVREHRPRPQADVPLVLDYDPGADAQVNWGEAQVLYQGCLPPEADSSSACAFASPSGTSSWPSPASARRRSSRATSLPSRSWAASPAASPTTT